jgi:multimeric flavodoxin WrbA
MKLIGICGSPRNGNTEWMLHKMLEMAEKGGAQAELILLRNKDIKLCDGCLSCEAGGKERKGDCKIKDDMQEIYPKLLTADAWVIGTPVYFGMVSGLLKNFMDRTCPIWTKLDGKPIAGIAVAEEGPWDVIANIKTYASVCGMKWIGSVKALAKTPRQVAKDETVEKRLARLTAKLLQSAV